jgi:hypothetical protein
VNARIGGSAVEIAAETERHAHPAILGRFQTRQGVESRRRRQGEAEVGFQSLDDCVLEFWRDADRSHPLHVGMTPDREQTGVRATHHAPHQRQIGDGLHILDAVSMMGDAHGPGENHLSTGGVNLGGTVDLLLRYAALGA